MTTGFQPEYLARLRGGELGGLSDDEIRWLVENYRSGSWLEQQLYNYIRAGRVSQEQAATVFDTVMYNIPAWERQVSAWEKEQEAIAQKKEWEDYQAEVEAQKAQVRESAEAQRAEAFFGGMAELGRIPPEEEFVRPPIPGEEKVAKSFLEETGLAKGTKLRSFLAGEFIPGIAEKTRGARAQWWARMHPEPTYEQSYDEAKAQLQEEAFRWGQKAWGPGQAPETEVSGGVYYGPSGLRALAEGAYRTALGKLGELRPEDFPERERRPEPGEDPLIAALRERRYKPQYYRKPGVGLVSRLTPAIRY